MNFLLQALMNGLETEILDSLPQSYPMLTGEVVAISDAGKNLYSTPISWAKLILVANFLRVQDAPYHVTEYGTVAVAEEPRPTTIPTTIEACKVPFNHAAYKRSLEDGSYVDWYTAQIGAKVEAQEAILNSVGIFGNPQAGNPGLLQGSGIPTVISNVNLASATPDQVVTELLRIALKPSKDSRRRFRPTKIAMPEDLYTLLNGRTFSTTDSRSIIVVFLERLATSPGYNTPDSPKFTLTSVPQFDDLKLMTVLPENPNLISFVYFPIEEFQSPDSSEFWGTSLASAHEFGYAGIVAKEPLAGVTATLVY